MEGVLNNGGCENILSIGNSPRSFVVKGRRTRMVAGDGKKRYKI